MNNTLTELELRETKVPTVETLEELSEYVDSLVNREHDYGTCVYAMSMSAVAAFNYVARQLRVSGFQASCADMDILTRVRRMKHGFRIVNYADLFYPQYWDDEQSAIFLVALKNSPKEWNEDTKKELAKSSGAVERVREHMEWIIEITEEYMKESEETEDE